MAGAKLRALQEGAAAFLSGLEEKERAALLTFRHEVRLVVPLTPDVASVGRALLGVSAAGSTALRDAVYAALRLRGPGAPRSVVVAFSDGVDSASWLTAPGVVEAARRSDAIVYAVAARRASDPEDSFLRDVADATGGRLWTVSREGDLRERFLDVLHDIRSRYVLSYAPQGGRSSGWHALRVRLRGKKGDVLARPGYWRAAPARQ
jgi:VWFA-related protein